MNRYPTYTPPPAPTRLVFADTETTSLDPGQIAQLAYIVEDDGTFIHAGSHYFEVDTMSPGAQSAHGLSLEMVRERARGYQFSTFAAEYWEMFKGRALVAHNVKFDLRFMAKEFGRCGRLYVPPVYCTMMETTKVCKIPNQWGKGWKWPKVEEALRALNIRVGTVNEVAEGMFDSPMGTGFHDARFDAAAVYLIYHEMMGRRK